MLQLHVMKAVRSQFRGVYGLVVVCQC